jgi:hypothetical protein
LEVLKISGLQSIGQPIIQVIQETLLFLLISVDFMRGIMRQLSEPGDVSDPKTPGSQTWTRVLDPETPSLAGSLPGEHDLHRKRL